MQPYSIVNKYIISKEMPLRKLGSVREGELDIMTTPLRGPPNLSLARILPPLVRPQSVLVLRINPDPLFPSPGSTPGRQPFHSLTNIITIGHSLTRPMFAIIKTLL